MIIDLFGHNEPDKLPGGAMCQQYIEPPFTILDARSARWKQRKNDWLDLGIESEIGRANDVSGIQKDGPIKKGTMTDITKGTSPEIATRFEAAGNHVSIFDPVLCELMYTWFPPAKKSCGVLDPFAGGSVRGIVAGRLGLQYLGIDLRKEQTNANEKQANTIPCRVVPRWSQMDSRTIRYQEIGESYGMLFTCPPYFDLEIYSNDKRDLSRCESYNRDFIYDLSDIISKCYLCLQSPAWAVIVVGPIRDKDGNLRDFRGDTVRLFRNAGFHFYNEAILVTPIGSLPIRASYQFDNGRKLGAAHQNVLIFRK